MSAIVHHLPLKPPPTTVRTPPTGGSETSEIIDHDKIGFTLDVAMRLAGDRPPDEETNPVSYLEVADDTHLADSA